jgi:hypothetical protein
MKSTFFAAPNFMSRPPTRREMRQKDEELILRGSPTKLRRGDSISMSTPRLGQCLRALPIMKRRMAGAS